MAQRDLTAAGRRSAGGSVHRGQIGTASSFVDIRSHFHTLRAFTSPPLLPSMREHSLQWRWQLYSGTGRFASVQTDRWIIWQRWWEKVQIMRDQLRLILIAT